MTVRLHSQVRRAHLTGWRDRRHGLPNRAETMAGSDLYVAYLEGWQDGERLPRVARPRPLAPLMVELAAEGARQEGRAA
jgi:hypothetical protein